MILTSLQIINPRVKNPHPVPLKRLKEIFEEKQLYRIKSFLMNNAVVTQGGNYSSTFCYVIKKAKMNEIPTSENEI